MVRNSFFRWSSCLALTSRSAFFEAVDKHNLKEVKRFLKEGMQVDACYRDNVTALHRACSAGHLDIVEFLLEKGADVNKADYVSILPRHH